MQRCGSTLIELAMIPITNDSQPIAFTYNVISLQTVRSFFRSYLLGLGFRKWLNRAMFNGYQHRILHLFRESKNGITPIHFLSRRSSIRNCVLDSHSMKSSETTWNETRIFKYLSYTSWHIFWFLLAFLFSECSISSKISSIKCQIASCYFIPDLARNLTRKTCCFILFGPLARKVAHQCVKCFR